MDRSRQSVPREGRRGDIVRDVAEVGDWTGAATRTALRGGARQCRRLELPLAVHTSESSRATSLVTPSACGATSWQIGSALGLGHVCAAFDIDPGNKARLIAQVEDLKRRMCRVESPNRVGVVGEGVQAAL